MEFQFSTEIQRREDFGGLCNHHGLLGIAVEIGVDQGNFAVDFLRQWKGRIYVGVDPWRNLPEYDNEPISNVDRQPHFNATRAKIDEFWPRAALLCHTSEVAAGLLPNGLDFVYVDANHKYEEAARDIALWWPKIRSGGCLAGHDYSGAWHATVGRAVNEFAAREGVPVTLVHGPMQSWYVFRP